jgi:hypothetical protein
MSLRFEFRLVIFGLAYLTQWKSKMVAITAE